MGPAIGSRESLARTCASALQRRRCRPRSCIRAPCAGANLPLCRIQASIISSRRNQSGLSAARSGRAAIYSPDSKKSCRGTKFIGQISADVVVDAGINVRDAIAPRPRRRRIWGRLADFLFGVVTPLGPNTAMPRTRRSCRPAIPTIPAAPIASSALQDRITRRSWRRSRDNDPGLQTSVPRKYVAQNARLLDGATFDLGKLRGKVVMVNYWATWCAPCRKEMPQLDTFYRKYHSQGLEMVGISIDFERDLAKARKAARDVTYPIAFAKAISDDGFGVPKGVPITWIIDTRPHTAIFSRSARRDHWARRPPVRLHTVRSPRIACRCRFDGRRATRLRRFRSSRRPLPIAQSRLHRFAFDVLSAATKAGSAPNRWVPEFNC